LDLSDCVGVLLYAEPDLLCVGWAGLLGACVVDVNAGEPSGVSGSARSSVGHHSDRRARQAVKRAGSTDRRRVGRRAGGALNGGAGEDAGLAAAL
jgi:hypothetical protein